MDVRAGQWWVHKTQAKALLLTDVGEQAQARQFDVTPVSRLFEKTTSVSLAVLRKSYRLEA